VSNKPLVSAIIIFLNAGQFIQEAIESVFAQTYGAWELLLVDDGSTDTSTAIAQRYVRQNPARIRYLEHDGHQNRGMSASRNVGVLNAMGEYIALLDADDVWLPEKLEQQVAILGAQAEAAMVYGPTQYWYSWTGKPEDIGRDAMRPTGAPANRLLKPPTLLPLFLREVAFTPATCSVLIRRASITRIGGFEERFRGLYEDQAFFYKLCLAEPVFVTSACWDRYRQHADSWCAVAQSAGEYNEREPHAARLTFLNWLAEYLSKQGIKDAEVWQALQQALWPYRHPLLDRLLRRSRRRVRRIRKTLVARLSAINR
jgi:glycosyltransferase involved in cell wall biosynthesis